MKDWQSQAHVKWDCKYHVVIVPKYRQKCVFRKAEKADRGNSAGIVSAEGNRFGGRQRACPTTSTCC